VPPSQHARPMFPATYTPICTRDTEVSALVGHTQCKTTSWVQTPNTNGCRPLILFFWRAHRIPVPGRPTSGSRPQRAVTMLCSTSKGVCSGPPPRLAVGGLARRKEHGLTLTLPDVYYVKPMCPSGEHGRGYHPAPGGSASREKCDRGHTYTRTRTASHQRGDEE